MECVLIIYYKHLTLDLGQFQCISPFFCAIEQIEQMIVKMLSNILYPFFIVS